MQERRATAHTHTYICIQISVRTRVCVCERERERERKERERGRERDKRGLVMQFDLTSLSHRLITSILSRYLILSNLEDSLF